ncbi:MAG TPA: thioredoxin, partial [Syntrophorhabdus aromaticivorans]|nr:thioredoxin [Syntrophorhabdus aromaticivorans]
MLLASAVLITVLSVLLVVFFAPHDGIIEVGKLAKGSRKLPCLVDVGADHCAPCAKMVPVLEELKKEYAGVLIVELVDVGKNPEAGQRYEMRSVPTQIFYDA